MNMEGSSRSHYFVISLAQLLRKKTIEDSFLVGLRNYCKS
jgi:hypothetical protein